MVPKLAPAAQEVVDLRVREKDAHDDAHEAEEKLTALIERVCMDVMEGERLWKERDDLLQVMEELCTGTELAHQERAVAQQRIGHLENELRRERDLKVAAEGVSASSPRRSGSAKRRSGAWRPR